VSFGSIGGREPTPSERGELRREQELREAMRSGLPEIERSRLRFERFYVVDEPTGNLFRLLHGAVDPVMGQPSHGSSPAAAMLRSSSRQPGRKTSTSSSSNG
jgi:hypothetical protein